MGVEFRAAWVDEMKGVRVGVDLSRPGGDQTAVVLMGRTLDGRFFIFDPVSVERDRLERDLRERGVSPEIIERVLRLNPRPQLGEKLRGIHYKEGRGWGFMRDYVQKGYVLRVYGHEVWGRIPRSAHIKRGRRVWVRGIDVARAQGG